MKTLNDYMAMSYRMEIVEDKEEGGFVVFYLDLPGCITCGETIESAVENAQDAKKAWLEAALEDSSPSCNASPANKRWALPESSLPESRSDTLAGSSVSSAETGSRKISVMRFATVCTAADT